MKPIIPGCRCIITADKHTPENIGKVVTVIKRYDPGTFFFFRYKDGKLGRFVINLVCWSTVEVVPAVVLGRDDLAGTTIPIFDMMTRGENLKGLVAEHRLMRIDGEDFDDNPYKENMPISDILARLQMDWMDHPETWDEYQRRVTHG